jgi:membrane protease YdiL (CAAX protease family)
MIASSNGEDGETARIPDPLPSPAPRPDASARIIRWGVCLELSLAIVALVIGRAIGVDPLETVELSWEATARHLRAIVWGSVATLPMLAVMIGVEQVPWGPVRQLRNLVRHAIAPLFAQQTLGGLAAISAAAGWGEEMLFRGLLQTGLARWLDGGPGVCLAIALSSVAFGLAHCITPTYVVLATLIGSYLGWLFWISDQLLVPIVAHALYDFLALLYFVKWKK